MLESAAMHAPGEAGSSVVATPRRWARLAGIFELLEGAASSSGQVFILKSLIVAGNAAATAGNILAHENLYRLGFLLSVIAVPFHLAWALYFYRLFLPVNRNVSRLAAWVNLVGCALQAVAAALYVGPLVVLQHAGALGAFSEDQRQSLAYLLLRLNGSTSNLYLAFFGMWCVLAGHLMYRSGFLPRIFGVLWMIDGLGWMMYLWPPLGAKLFPFIATASGLAEIPMPWWLIFAGVNERRWHERANR
jgi:hypothetical protein